MVRALPNPGETWVHIETGRRLRIDSADATTGAVVGDVGGRRETTTLRILFREFRSPEDQARARAGFAALLDALDGGDRAS